MLKKFIGYTLFVFFILNCPTVYAFDKEQKNKDDLGNIGRNYQIFLNFAGSDAVDCLSIEAEAPSLFAEGFRKIVNNQLVLEGRNGLGSHLWGFRENLGRWKINPDAYSLLSSTDGFSHITVTYIVETIDKIQPIRQIVMAILKVDADGKILELFEVYHPLEITNS